MTEQDRENVRALLMAYRQGAFPMADPESGEIAWYRPDPRAIIPLDRFHLPDSLRRRTRSGRFVITCDRAFSEVIRSCADPRPEREATWIDDRIVYAFESLHAAGHAHSIEAWIELDAHEGETLVGGLYGVHVGGFFAGESMFSRPELGGTDASKVCLVHLVHHLRRRGVSLLDVQFENPHLDQFGVELIPCDEYLQRLHQVVDSAARWMPFEPEHAIQELAGN